MIVHGWEQVKYDLECLAIVLREDIFLVTLAFGGMATFIIMLLLGTNVGVVSAILLGSIPHVIISYLLLKLSQQDIIRDGIGINDPHWTTTEIRDTMSEQIPEESFISNEAFEHKQGMQSKQLGQMLRIRQRQQRENTPSSWRKEEKNEQTTINSKTERVVAVRECRQYAEVCCICCEEFEPGEKIRILPHCGHEYHTACIDTWALTFATCKMKQMMGASPTCPICNAYIFTTTRSFFTEEFRR